LLALTDSKHTVQLTNSGNGFDDFNAMWVTALNASEEGKITHVAMLHLDIAPLCGREDGIWLDTLIAELDRLDLDFVSAISPMKDGKGLVSSGIGDPNDPWTPYRRIAIRELSSLPETFDAATLGYAGWPLLHNSGCWAADLRKPIFHQTDAKGECPMHFGFPEKVFRNPVTGKWEQARESEDWFFSRCLFQVGAKTAVTRKVKLIHWGRAGYGNFGTWGQLEHDTPLAYKWAVPRGPWDEIQGWFDFADIYEEQIARVNGEAAHFVEVGAWLGKSTVFMASKIRGSGKPIAFDCVDTWKGGTNELDNGLATAERLATNGRDLFAEFSENVKECGVAEYIRPVRSDSAEAAGAYLDGSLDFVFIDADHSYEGVRRDLAAWWPKVKPTGVLAGHDYDEKGVRKAVDEFVEAHHLKVQSRHRSFVLERNNKP
jgi:hypothetical protein